METAPAKSLFKSKTVLLNALIGLAVFYPPVGAWVQQHPDLTLQILAGINVLVRLGTKGKVALFPTE